MRCIHASPPFGRLSASKFVPDDNVTLAVAMLRQAHHKFYIKAWQLFTMDVMYADNAGCSYRCPTLSATSLWLTLRIRFAHSKTLIPMDGVYAEAMLGALPVLAFLLCPWMDGSKR
jgi:hypothetical protein